MKALLFVLLVLVSCGGGQPAETDTTVQCLTTCPDGTEPKMEYQCYKTRRGLFCCGLVGAFCSGELLDAGAVCEQEQGFCR